MCRLHIPEYLYKVVFRPLIYSTLSENSMQHIGKQQDRVPEKVKKKGLISSLTYCKYINNDVENVYKSLRNNGFKEDTRRRS